MENLPEQIRNEQIRLVYKQAPVILIGSFIAAVALVYFFWGKVPNRVLILWSVLFTAIAFLRAILIRVYWVYLNRPDFKGQFWGSMLTIGAGLAGCLWGVAAVIFYLPAESESILLLLCLYAALVASSGASSGAYMPVFIFFAIPAVTPFAFRLLMDGQEIFTIMGILSIVYLIVCTLFVRTYHKNTNLLISTQFENKLLLDQLQQEKQIAEQAVIEKNRFLAAASHDLRQPLHALGLFIGALRRETPESKSQLLESIEGSVGALYHLFNGLLDVSRLDAGVVTANEKHVDLDVLLQRLKSEHLEMAEERDLSFSINCENLVVKTDPVLLERILRNLIINAIYYTNEGRVTVQCDSTEAMVSIKIIDTGVGIPSSESEAIFSEYFQLNNPERDRNKGLGLGLAIVRRLCELMEIPLAVESVERQGTTFSLQLKSGDAKFIDQLKPAFELSNMADLSILVIDDEKTVLQGMQSIFSTWDSKVLLAESASEAIAQIAEQNFMPDIILSDYQLCGNKTGVDAIEAVREELNRDVPAIIITGDTSPERIQEASASGFHLLHKPVTPDTLRQVLLSMG